MLWDPSKTVWKRASESHHIAGFKRRAQAEWLLSMSHLIAISGGIFWNDRYQQSGPARAYNYCVIISHLSCRVTCFHKAWSCFLHSNHIAWGAWSWVKLLHCRIQWSLNRQMIHFCYCAVIFLSMYLRSQKPHGDTYFSLSFCKWTKIVMRKVMSPTVGYFSIVLTVTHGKW